MNPMGLVLIILGVLFVTLGIYFLRSHYLKLTPNDELVWLGYGKHPFRKE